MIQRIQSVYLLLVCILMAFTVFSPLLAVSTATGATVTFDSFGVFTKQISFFTWGIVSVAGICAIVPLINLFLYKKRKLQIKIGWITFLLILLFYVTVFVYFNALGNKHEVVFENIEYGIVLPLIALIFNILAILKIKKDDNLVKSLDRIR